MHEDGIGRYTCERGLGVYLVAPLCITGLPTRAAGTYTVRASKCIFNSSSNDLQGATMYLQMGMGVQQRDSGRQTITGKEEARGALKWNDIRVERWGE